MKVTTEMVKKLREKTGAGILDSKKALIENNGDILKAQKWLNENGLLKAAKKSERVAADGLSKVVIKGNRGLIIEVNTETDFVAKNSTFINLLDNISNSIIQKEPKDIKQALSIILENGKTIDEEIKSNIAIIGENISLRRFDYINLTSENSVLGSYSHLGGKISVLVQLEGTTDQKLANDIAMHIAGLAPLSISIEDLPKDIVETKRNEFMNETKKEGKPDNIIEKIVTGKMSKYFSDVVLLEQNFVNNTDIKVKDFLKQHNIEVKRFIRYFVGEGIEKVEVNFAEEVRQQIK